MMIRLRQLLSVFVVLSLVLVVSATLCSASVTARRSPVVEVVEKAGPAVVNIRTEQIVKRRGSPLFGFGDTFFEEFFRGFGPTRVYKTQSLGSGAIIDPRGYVLTNAHVIEQASKIYVALSGEQKEVEAKLVGMQENLDIAVIKIERDGSYPYLKAGTTSDLMLGETVVAIGNPLGLDNSVTTGVISSVRRRVPMEDGFVGHFIQTDALINPGNSGGPLLNIEGALIGINTAIASQAQGIGFSIPADMAMRVANDLISYGKVRKSYFGVLPGNVNQALVRSRGVGGVLVTDVDNGSPAEKAGFRIADVILEVDGQTVESPQELALLLDSFPPGNQVRFRLLRGTDILERKVALQPLPKDYGLAYSRKVFGIVPADGKNGVFVKKVVDGSFADNARFKVGDAIAEVAGVKIDDLDSYREIMERNIGVLPLSFLVVRDNHGYYVTLP